MIRPAILAATLALAGCTHTNPEPVIRTVTVTKPVALECVPVTMSPAPEYPDTDEALRNAVDAAERYRLVAAGRILRNARLGEVEPVLLTCKSEASK